MRCRVIYQHPEGHEVRSMLMRFWTCWDYVLIFPDAVAIQWHRVRLSRKWITRK